MNWKDGKATAGILDMSVEKCGEEFMWCVEWGYVQGEERECKHGFVADEPSAIRASEEDAAQIGIEIFDALIAPRTFRLVQDGPAAVA